jgi:hypothetical protein
MIKDIGKIINRPTKTGGKLYDKFFIYIPTSVAKDSAFLFKSGEEVVVRIEGKKLVIEKLSKHKR